MAVGTADASKTFREITTRNKSGHAAVDDGSPETVLGLKALVIPLPEGVKMLIDQSPQVGGLGIAWAVQWQRLAAGKRHDQAHPGRAAHDAPRARARSKPLVEGASEGKECFLPGHLEPFQIEFGQFQKIAPEGKRPASQKHIEMRMPIQGVSLGHVQAWKTCYQRSDEPRDVEPLCANPLFRTFERPYRNRPVRGSSHVHRIDACG